MVVIVKISPITKLIVKTMKNLNVDRMPDVWSLSQDEFIEKYGEYDDDKSLSKIFYSSYYGDGCISKFDPEFPDMSHISVEDRPSVLFYKGHVEVLSDLSINVAVVGSREPVIDTVHNFPDILSNIAKNGYNIVSGLSIGSNTEAHSIAVRLEKPTIAVVSTHLAKVYPHANLELSEEITKHGIIVSEYCTSDDTKEQFNARLVKRSELIASLSDKVILSQSERKFEAKDTCYKAIEIGKPVYVLSPLGFVENWDLNNDLLIKGYAKIIN